MAHIELLTRDAQDRVTSVAAEDQPTMDEAIKAARRLAGAPRRKLVATGAGTWSVTGANGTAHITR